MPINAEIPLQVKVPQVDTAGIVNQIQHGRQMQMEQQRLQMQQTAASEQTQLHNLTIQDHQREVDDESNKTKAYNDAGGDLTKFQELAGKYGVSAKGQAAIQKQIADHQKDLLGMDKEKRVLAESTVKAVGSSSASLLSLPDEQARAANWGNVRGSLIQQGFAKPEDIPEQYPGEQFLVDHRNASLTAEQQLDNVRKVEEAKRQQGEFDIKAQEAQLKQEAAAREKLARENPNDPALQAAAMDAKGRLEEAHRKITEAETSKQHAATNAHEQQRIGIQGAELGIRRQELATKQAEADPYGNLGVNKNPIKAPVDASGAELHGDEYLKTLPPTLAAKVRAVAEGRQPIPTSRGGVLKGEGKAISDAVYNYDQGFSTQRAQVRSDFAKDKNIGSLNTAAVHLDQFMDAAAALKNGSFRPGNAAFNAVKEMFGDTAPTNFEMLKNVAVGEAANALKGSATDVEIASIKKGLDRANSPEQFEGALKELMRTYGAKLNTYQERYTQLNPGDKAWSPVLPSAKAAFQKRGVSESGRPSASGSTTANRKPLSEIFK